MLELQNEKARVCNNAQVVVAMSGGVDSAAAAVLLSEAGFDVVGISMQVWDYRRHGGNAKRATCCAPADFDDARAVATACNFPFYVFDFEDSFERSVITPFVEAYRSGKTPNPCVECNRKVKFRELRNRARALGIPRVATGHYAIRRELSDGTFGLFTARDTGKDQSYFLFALTQEELRDTLFPLGSLLKSEVRELLSQRGFAIASKAESQDICFVSTTAAEFVEQRLKQEEQNGEGEIVSLGGKTLGRHRGIHRYTVGQRRGLAISNASMSNSEPLYVLGIDAERNEVQVGAKHELERREFEVSEVNWISGELPSETIRVRAKLRYRHAGVMCDITRTTQGRVQAQFVDQWTAVSPGQAAVFYATEAEPDGSVRVFGGGTIV